MSIIIIIIIMLGLQQSPGRCKTPTWKSLSTRLPVLTSRLITTSETPQVRISSACAADDQPWAQSVWPKFPACLADLCPEADGTKDEEQWGKTTLELLHFFSRDYNCVNSSCLCRPKNSFCYFFFFLLFMFWFSCRTRKILDMCTICRFQ